MGYVVLSHAGRHLGLVPDLTHGQSRLRPVDGPPTAAGVFRRLPLSHDRVALQTLDGRYLQVREDEAMSFGVYAAAEFGPRATFEEVRWPSGEVSLRTHALTFLSVAPSGRVTANRTVTEAGERFVLAPAPRHLLPAVAVPEPDIARVVSFPRQAVPAPARQDSGPAPDGGTDGGTDRRDDSVGRSQD